MEEIDDGHLKVYKHKNYRLQIHFEGLHLMVPQYPHKCLYNYKEIKLCIKMQELIIAACTHVMYTLYPPVNVIIMESSSLV